MYGGSFFDIAVKIYIVDMKWGLRTSFRHLMCESKNGERK